MRELKPCPFCGGEGDWYEVKPGYGYVSCDTCDATIGCFDALPKQDAIDAWNTRAVEVVRCRDCDSWSGPCEMRPGSVDGVCDGWSATGNVVLTREDDFCSYGARREEER